MKVRPDRPAKARRKARHVLLVRRDNCNIGEMPMSKCIFSLWSSLKIKSGEGTLNIDPLRLQHGSSQGSSLHFELLCAHEGAQGRDWEGYGPTSLSRHQYSTSQPILPGCRYQTQWATDVWPKAPQYRLLPSLWTRTCQSSEYKHGGIRRTRLSGGSIWE